LSERFALALERGDEAGARQIVRAAASNGASPLALAEHFFAPAMMRIGEAWELGRLGIAEEHLASRICEAAAHELRASAAYEPSNGLQALVACLPGEWHALGALLFAELLRSRGWETSYLGADTPVSAVADFAARRQTQLVVLTGTYAPARESVAPAVAALRALVEPPTVLVGGRAASWPESAGADLRAGSFAEGLRLADSLAERLHERSEAQSLASHLGAIGERLSALRRERGWSQSELADAAKLDRTYVSGVERGKQNPTIGVLLRLATALGVRIDKLLLG